MQVLPQDLRYQEAASAFPLQLLPPQGGPPGSQQWSLLFLVTPDTAPTWLTPSSVAPHYGPPKRLRTGPLLTTVLLISSIPAVVGAIALAPNQQADAIILTTEGSVGRTHKPGCRRQSQNQPWGQLWATGEHESRRLQEPIPRPPGACSALALQPHRTPQGSHLSCPHSRPRHHTSTPGACTGCYCTGTHPGGRSALGAMDNKGQGMS